VSGLCCLLYPPAPRIFQIFSLRRKFVLKSLFGGNLKPSLFVREEISSPY